MSDDPEEPESKAGEPKPPKKRAEENAWYLLATLYGVPGEGDDELREKNRVAWNRYFAGNLDEARRTQLIAMKRHSSEELPRFLPIKVLEVEEAFAERCKGLATPPVLPKCDADIDFSSVKFDRDVSFAGYLFIQSSFKNAVFSGWTNLSEATFLRPATFERSNFSKGANFEGVSFAPADFRGANFYGYAKFQSAIFSESIDFQDATFSGAADFQLATFSGRATFYRAIFFGRAKFNGAIFSVLADIARATFSMKTTFSRVTFFAASTFVNAEMKSETYFDEVTFKTSPPKFFGAKLHEGTIWPSGDAKERAWPFPKGKAEAGKFVRAYERLI